MYPYFVSGLALHSCIKLPHLLDLDRSYTKKNILTLKSIKKINYQNDDNDIDWFHFWSFENTPYIRFGKIYSKIGTTFVIEAVGVARFYFNEKNASLQCDILPRIDDETFFHALLDQALPLILSLQDTIIVHASSIKTSRGAYVFIGDSGSGKSSLAANLHHDGYPLLSDDFVRIDTNQLWGSYGSTRVLKSVAQQSCFNCYRKSRVAQYTDKVRIDLNTNEELLAQPHKIKTCFFLNTEKDEDEIKITNIPNSHAAIQLIKSAYRVEPKNQEKTKRELELVCEITEEIDMFQLQIPYGFEESASTLTTIKEKIISEAT